MPPHHQRQTIRIIINRCYRHINGARGYNGVIDHLWGNQSMGLLTKLSFIVPRTEWPVSDSNESYWIEVCERNVYGMLFVVMFSCVQSLILKSFSSVALQSCIQAIIVSSILQPQGATIMAEYIKARLE